MRSGKAPQHISLPPKPAPNDVFTSSALDSNTSHSASSANNDFDSPGVSPYRDGGRQDSIYGSMRGSTGQRRASRNQRLSVGAGVPRSVRNSFAAGGGGARRTSRASWVDSVRSRRALLSPGLLSPGGAGEGDDEAKPAIPSLAVGIRPAYSTPLPLLPMIVLCIAMLSEFLSANTPTPFLLKMVESFFVPEGEAPSSDTEAKVGLWTGNLVSVFFITQFFTSLLWSGIAGRYGRRAVLVVCMAGSALTVMLFGTSRSLPEAICIRLGQGIFSGAIGVFRGSIRDITDSTNETRAYALLGFSWGMGGVIGPILGGVFESPAKNYPDSFFAKLPLFINFPYLLPCLIAGTILAIGSLLSFGLSWDGGPRRSRIALPIEKTSTADQAGAESIRARSPSPTGLAASVRRKASSIFTRVADAAESAGQLLTPQQARLAAVRDQEAQERVRRASRGSMGTAYGYGGIRVKREFMAAQAAAAARRASNATIRPGDEHEPEGEEGQKLNLAQKLLLANEENTFNLNDLWVSAAIAQDTAVFDDEDEEGDEDEELLEGEEAGDSSHVYTDSISRATPAYSHRHPSVSPSVGGERSPLLEVGNVPPPAGAKPRLGGADGLLGATASTAHRTFSLRGASGNHAARRVSGASGMVPAIFANTGLNTPPAIAAALEQDYIVSSQATSPAAGIAVPPAIPEESTGRGGLSAIQERRGSSAFTKTTDNATIRAHTEEPEKPAATGWRSLPLLIILQYGLLALHDTVHGQIFLSFLVSTYKSGGVGLLPSSFSLLIALMCLFQLYYQFYLYPHLGPPRGRLSHLQMFRLGSMLFIPAYLTLPLLRAFTSDGKHGGFVVMTLVTINMACRYCGGVFAYTSVMVLINAMSPPPVVGLANGLAQSLVSLGRFVGPVIGGGLWSSSISGNPSGYFFPFYAVAGMCAVQVLLSYLIR